MKNEETATTKQADTEIAAFRDLASKIQAVLDSKLTPTGIHLALLAQVEKIGEKFGDYEKDEIDQFAEDLLSRHNADFEDAASLGFEVIRNGGLPELLEAVCTHTDCPEWLKHDIWDSFNEWADNTITLRASEWRAFLDRGVRLDDPRDRDHCWTPTCNSEIVWYRYCADCLRKKADEATQRSSTRRLSAIKEVSDVTN